MERVGERFVLLGGHLHLRQRLCDVVETSSFGSTWLVPPAQKIKLPVWWAMAVPLLILAVIFPTAIAAIAVIWVFRYTVVVAYPGVGKMV